MKNTVFAVTCTALFSVTFTHQAIGLGSLSGANTQVSQPPSSSPVPIFSTGVTDSIVKDINDVVSVCQSVDELYRLDCLARQLKTARRDLRNLPDYKPVSQALGELASALDAIVKEFEDRQAAKQRFAGQKTDGRTTKTPKLKAIQRAALSAANAAARAALKRAVGNLQRSVENNDPRKVHFQRIAAAMDGTVVLMRS